MEGMETIKKLADLQKRSTEGITTRDYWEMRKLREQLLVDDDNGFLGEPVKGYAKGTIESVEGRITDELDKVDDDPFGGENFNNPEAEALYYALQSFEFLRNMGLELEPEEYEGYQEWLDEAWFE